jgi:hypothetical protein
MATFSSGVKCFRSFLIRSLRYLNGGTLSPFPAEAEHFTCGISFPPAIGIVPHIVKDVSLRDLNNLTDAGTSLKQCQKKSSKSSA